jgi:hypothetical protein
MSLGLVPSRSISRRSTSKTIVFLSIAYIKDRHALAPALGADSASGSTPSCQTHPAVIWLRYLKLMNLIAGVSQNEIV